VRIDSTLSVIVTVIRLNMRVFSNFFKNLYSRYIKLMMVAMMQLEYNYCQPFFFAFLGKGALLPLLPQPPSPHLDPHLYTTN
jgi:hypothetical protein